MVVTGNECIDDVTLVGGEKKCRKNWQAQNNGHLDNQPDINKQSDLKFTIVHKKLDRFLKNSFQKIEKTLAFSGDKIKTLNF
jgi:hypothetical protein